MTKYREIIRLTSLGFTQRNILFPKSDTPATEKRMPDYSYIRKELLRNGATKKLLRTEYIEDCRLNGDEPLVA